MKQYGFMKATEFSQKQINVIYAKAKSGELHIEKWYINEFFIKKIINAVFENDIDNAQKLIDEDTERYFKLYSDKQRSKFDRSHIA